MERAYVVGLHCAKRESEMQLALIL
jgi:hypothetical protein